MNRTRSRTSTKKRDLRYGSTRWYHQIYYDTTSVTHSEGSSEGFPCFDRSEVIADMSTPVRSLNRFRPWLNPLHECTHTKKYVEWNSGNLVRTSGYINPGWEEATITEVYPSPVDYLYFRYFGTDLNKSPDLWIDTVNSADAYGSVDWFSLKDSFYEACDSIIPQAFFFGEDAVENDLFVEAFKTILNPSKAVSEALKFFSDSLRSTRKLRSVYTSDGVLYKTDSLVLGHSKLLARAASNSDLLYNFAIKPAIQDIRSCLDAHRIITARLDFLASKRGTFVPIRAKQKTKSAIGSASIPTQLMTQDVPFMVYTDKQVVGSISGYGKVRSDITVQPSWAAYIEYFGLNKIVGTAWELIPYSFIVDWFTNAQERINSLTRLRVSDPYSEIRNILYGVKRQTRRSIYCLPPKMFGAYEITSPKKPFACGVLTESDYSRTLSCPDAEALFGGPSLSVGKKVSLGSLLIQRALK